MQSFAREDLAIKQYDEICTETKTLAARAAVFQGFAGGCFLLAMFAFFLYAYSMGSLLIQYQVINPVSGKPYNIFEVVAATQASVMAMMTLAGITPILPAISRALICGKKIFDVIEREPQIKSLPNAIENIRLKDKISFKDVHFRYPTAPDGSRDTFQGVSFDIKAGTSTAIVGPSGSGKSTIVQMINRFYVPSKGTIEFDGTNLENLSMSSLRNIIGYVSQEPVLILGTIRENLMYGNKDANEEDLREALRLANATFVEQLENGIDSYVGAASVMALSGGQKQRIAIARALIKKPRILILDEATSALDTKSEKEVQDAIDSIKQK